MRVEVVPYTNTQALYRALMDKEIHAACARREYDNQDLVASEDEQEPYHTTTRVQRLYEIMRTELSSPATSLTFVNASDSQEEQK
jgi:putative multicomponent Na+:H+ antiporter subunit B